MMSTATAWQSDMFRHEALLYDGIDEFASRVSTFVDDAIEADEPILVVAAAEKIARLQPSRERHHLVEFADMGEVGRNPALIIPAWSEFVARHEGSAVRGVGEPVTAEHNDIELVEYQHHEALLNLAFADTKGFWLVCPYDLGSLRADVIAEASRSHPFVTTADGRLDNDGYLGLDAVVMPDDRLPEPHVAFAEHSMRPGRLSDLRAFVAEQGRLAGLGRERLDDLVVAANELGSNSLLYGAGQARVRVWREQTVVCEIADAGRLTDPLIGRRVPGYEEHDSRGMWMVNQLCDLVQVRSSVDGTVVRLHMRVV